MNVDEEINNKLTAGAGKCPHAVQLVQQFFNTRVRI